MKLEQILAKFNNEGIFPTDDEMRIAIVGTKYGDIYDLEMELLHIAMEDQTHPYHHMTLPIK